MELDFTTFALEIVNFLVLMWLLRRFMFVPIAKAVAAGQAARVQAQEQLMAHERALQAQQLALTQQRQQLSDEQTQARAQLQEQLNQERQRGLKVLAQELEAERRKASATWERERDRLRLLEQQAAKQAGMGFVGHYLERLAGPELQSALVRLFIADLKALAKQDLSVLRADLAGSASLPPNTNTNTKAAIECCTSLACNDADRHALEAALGAIDPSAPARLQWRVEPALICGLSLRLGGHELECSLRAGMSALSQTPLVTGVAS